MAKRPPFTWSHSALETFEQCPKKYYHLKLKKDVKEDFSGRAAVEGKANHKSFEDRLAKNAPLPMELQHHEKFLAKLHNAKGTALAEQRMALNMALEPTGYFDSDVWVRGQADYAKLNGNKGIVFDWKFGKKKNNFDQLKLMGAMLMAYKPELDQLDTAFYWAKEKSVVPLTLTRDELPAIWNEFLPRVKNIDTAIKTTTFPAKESGLCKKFCPITSCPFNGAYNNGE